MHILRMHLNVIRRQMYIYDLKIADVGVVTCRVRFVQAAPRRPIFWNV